VPPEEHYLDLRNILGNRSLTRVLSKYKTRTATEEDNHISLLCDEFRIHFLLFLLKDETTYTIVNKPNKPTGGKSACKSKRGKSAK
jgi:hypothetical protein